MMRKRSGLSAFAQTSGIALLFASCAAASPAAWAQSSASPSQEEPQAAPDQAGSADIVVTASSRVNRKGFDAPTPTTVVSGDTLDAKSSRTLVETLSLLPAFRGTTTPGSTGAVAAGSGGGGFLNLRALGTTRTLVLLDRERLTPITVNGEIDVNLLPTELLSGVDVVTGGASASWGSDAVAGVVNFRLDSKYRGLGLEADSGISQYGDGAERKLGGKFGFSAGSLNIVGTIEHEENEGVPASGAQDRGFGRADYGTFTNPKAPPANAILPNIYANETFGGLIVGGPLNNTQILPGGALAPYVPCGPLQGTSYQCNGVRDDLPRRSYYNVLSAPLKRTSGFLRATWDVSPNFSLHADVLAGESKTSFLTVPATSIVGSIGTITVNRDNAYLPPALAAAMDANGLTTVGLRRFFRDEGPLAMSRDSGIIQGSVGLSGNLGHGWKVDAYASYGASKLDAVYNNITILQNFKNATDSVKVGGVPTCRINADAVTTNDDPACRPINFFGDGAALTTPDGLNYIAGRANSNTRSHQFASSATISGDPFSTWAGPVSIVLGAEYRNYTTRITVDSLSAANRFFAINPQPLAGTVNVKELFGETVIPLAKDLPFARNIELNAAGRLTDYSTSGTVKTWKLGLNYAPIEGLRFRGTISQDIRAPNINELFALQTATFAGLAVTDPKDNTTVFVATYAGGNPRLVPEVSKTRSVGVVLEPRFIPGFQLSVDYYNIKVAGSIATPTAQQILTLCAAGDPTFCNLVYRNGVAGAASGMITRIDAVYVNLAQFRTEGLDLEASYRFNLASGVVRLNALANHTINFLQQTSNVVLDSTGTQLNPKWTGDANATYDLGDTNFFVDATYRGGGRINASFTEAQLANNHTGSVIYINTALGRSIRFDNRRLDLRFSVNNLFDKKPPYGFPDLNNGDTYDRIGRFFKVSVKFAM